MTHNINGVKPFKEDLRDYKIKASVVEMDGLEIQDMPKVKNQSSVGSCVAHAASSILEYFNQKEIGTYKRLSTDFIYGMQGIEFNDLDSGMNLRDACKIVQKYGDALYDTIPTNTEMPKCTEELKDKLTDAVYIEAEICAVKSYARCKTNEDVKHALFNYGPVLAGIKWYNKYSLNDGVITFDTTSKYGYHAIVIYGFDERGWLVQNSWGTKWGNKGRFILPYEYGFSEAWSFVDAENEDIYKPKRNAFIDVLYKVINCILNLMKRSKKEWLKTLI